MNSSSLSESRNFTRKKASKTSPNVALIAEDPENAQEDRAVREDLSTLLSAQTAARKLRFPSSQDREDLFIAEIVLNQEKSN